MFFWTLLASLMGIVMFNNWRDNTKDQDIFVAPVYQTLALSTYQQHLAAEKAFLDVLRKKPAESMTKLESVSRIALYANNEADEFIKDEYEKYIPFDREGSSVSTGNTYLFCVSSDQTGLTSCKSTLAVRYIVTVNPIPMKFDNVNKMSMLKAIADATAESRFVGLLQQAAAPLSSSSSPIPTNQPLGAQYYILSGGTSLAGHVYIPNYITCNFPLTADSILGDNLENRNYIVALSLMTKLSANLSEPANTSVCAIKDD